MATTALISVGDTCDSGTSIRCSLAMVKTSRSAASKRRFAVGMAVKARNSSRVGILPTRLLKTQPKPTRNAAMAARKTRPGHVRTHHVLSVISQQGATPVPAQLRVLRRSFGGGGGNPYENCRAAP